MDDTISDCFGSGRDKYNLFDERKMYSPDFFYNMPPIPGSLGAVREIMKLGFDVYILTQPLANHFDSYSQKVKWINKWFPELSNKIVMTQHKGLHVGHYLIDDNAPKWKEPFEKNGGLYVHFRYSKERDSDEYHKSEWEQIVEFFRKEDPNY